MAQIVGYFEDNVVYTEGPFVAVDAWGWRIECEVKGTESGAPAFPDLSISAMLEKEKSKKPGKLKSFEEISPYVDWLNEQVKAGRIVLAFNANIWVAPEYHKGPIKP